MCTTVCNYTVITVQNVNFILHSTVHTSKIANSIDIAINYVFKGAISIYIVIIFDSCSISTNTINF